MILEAFVCSGNFGSIQLETVMQHLIVLAYIDLMQHAALIDYWSTPIKLLPIDGVNQSVVHYLFSNLDPCFTMHTWPFTWPL